MELFTLETMLSSTRQCQEILRDINLEKKFEIEINQEASNYWSFTAREIAPDTIDEIIECLTEELDMKGIEYTINN